MKSIILILFLICYFLIPFASSSSSSSLQSPLERHLQHQTEQHLLKYAADDPSNDCAAVPKQLFSQKLDHFNYLVQVENNVQSWGQRYSVQSDWYGGPGSPIFLFLGGEANMDFFCFQTVAIRAWARQFRALYIVLEHRFYGHSLPLGPDASTRALQFLSADQALADAALFIDAYNASLASPGPWVVFGCSYSSGLASWFRLKYPQLAVAAVCPSGPVHALLNFTGYFGHFERAAGPVCAKAVQGASELIYGMAQSQQGLDQLSQQFAACPSLQLAKANNTWYFLNQLMGAVGASDQFNNPPDWPLNATCAALLQNGTSPQQVAANWAALMGATDGKKCAMSVDEALYRAAMAAPLSSSGRSWQWQTCTEFSWLKPSYPGTSVFFPNQDLPHLLSYCQSAFGIDGMAPLVHQTNVEYGGRSPVSSNTIFTNGFYDPWHLVSITEDVPSPSSVQAVTYDAGHCAPLTAPTDQDPPSLVAARQAIVQFLTRVLQQ